MARGRMAGRRAPVPQGGGPGETCPCSDDNSWGSPEAMGEGPSVKMSCRTPRSTTRQGQQTQRLCLWGAPCVLLSIQRDQGQAAGATCPHSCPLHGRIAATVGRRPHRPERSRGMLAGLIRHQSQDWLNYFRKSDEEEQKRNCPFSVVCWFMEPRGGAGRPGVLRPRTS